MQINYRWHGHAFPSLEAMFDPEWTATYAAQFLRTLYEERGDWSAAAGAYHSLTPELAPDVSRRASTRMLAEPAPGALDAAGAAEALVASASGRRTTRAERREAQRRAIAERMRAAGPPAPPVNGGIAGALSCRRRRAAARATPRQGQPLLTQGQPLLAAPGGSLF